MPVASPSFRVFAQTGATDAWRRGEQASASSARTCSAPRAARAAAAHLGGVRPVPVRPRRLEDRRELLEGGVGEERAQARRPSARRRSTSWRSRFEPSAAFVSLTCRQRSRSSPIRASRSATAASRTAVSVTSTPETYQWHESRQSPSRGWWSSASWIAASSSVERPIVPPAPAEFSISSQRSSVVSSSSSRSAGTTCSSPASKPAPRCEPTWKMTPSAPIAAAASSDDAHRRDRLLVDHRVGRGEVDEVERVADDALDPGLLAALAEARDRLGRVVRRPPHPRALGEHLHGVAPDRLGPVDRLPDAAGGRDVGAEQHPPTLPARRRADA